MPSPKTSTSGSKISSRSGFSRDTTRPEGSRLKPLLRNLPHQYPSPSRAWYLVTLLTVAYVFSFVDKYLPALLVEPIKHDLDASDTQMGLLLGPAFAVLYATLGLPLGWLADKVDRRRVLLLCGAVAFAGALVLPFTQAAGWLGLALALVWGGFIAGLYSVGLAHLGANFRGGELAAANSAVMEMCIDNPRTGFTDIFATHPSIESRVDAIVKYAGGRDPGPLALEAPEAQPQLEDQSEPSEGMERQR